MAKVIPIIYQPGNDSNLSSTIVWSVFTIWTTLQQVKADYVLDSLI